MKALTLMAAALLTCCAMASTQSAPDPRLDQKITYDSGAKRLHDVVDDLARMSGVTIRCGQGEKNWRVRDIPVVVCVKDMPLGKLLKAIADATHTRLTGEKTEKDSQLIYRIYRRTPDQDAIDSYSNGLDDSLLAQGKWEWDAMVAYGKSAEIKEIPHDTWLIARLICPLGSGGWDRLANGETLHFTVRDSGAASVFEGLYRYCWDQFNKNDSANTYSPTNQDIENAALRMKYTKGQGVQICFVVRMTGDTWCEKSRYPKLSNYQSELRSFNLPPYPETWKPAIDANKMEDPNLVPLPQLKVDQWTSPLLATRFDLEKPKDVKDLRFADFVRALASASGLNIVIEDFVSQKDPPDYGRNLQWSSLETIDGLFKKKTTVAETLAPYRGPERHDWFFSEGDKLLVGWIPGWCEAHQALLSEQYLNGIMSKYEGDGLDLDDVISVVTLPSRSLSDWIVCRKGFQCVWSARMMLDAAWSLYGALEPADKLLAQSEAGLSLAKLEPRWVAGTYAAQRKLKLLQPGGITFEPAQDVTSPLARIAEERRLFEAQDLSDPSFTRNMIMRVRKSSPEVRSGVRGFEKIPPALNLSKYTISVDFTVDGELHKVSDALQMGLGVPIPLRSPEREAEIIKAAKEAETKPGSNTAK